MLPIYSYFLLLSFKPYILVYITLLYCLKPACLFSFTNHNCCHPCPHNFSVKTKISNMFIFIYLQSLNLLHWYYKLSGYPSRKNNFARWHAVVKIKCGQITAGTGLNNSILLIVIPIYVTNISLNNSWNS